MREREAARRAAQEQRREERARESRPEESLGYFNQQFSARKTAIEAMLLEADSLLRDQLPSHFERLFTEYHALQKFTSDSALFLTSYDLRSSQQLMTQLEQDISARQDQLLPKKKFAFKARKKEAPQPQPPPSQPQLVEEGKGGRGEVKASPVTADENLVGFRDRRNDKLQLGPEEVRGHDVNLSGLRGCDVRLRGPPSTLHMSRMEACLVLCGPVASSVFVEDCKDCTFVVACQQLRVHTTHHSKFYIHVSSRAIIEDCSHAQFAPYNWTYPDIERHFEDAGLDGKRNNWSLVDDFNWLASRDPSPNWSVLPEAERAASWD